MQFKKEDRSIFPENFVEMQGAREAEVSGKISDAAENNDILNEIEFLNARVMRLSGHVLSENSGLDAETSAVNNISDLVKMGHGLPKVESPEKMLVSDNITHKKQEASSKGEESNSKIEPYRIVNLISGSYKLPEIDDESFFR